LTDFGVQVDFSSSRGIFDMENQNTHRRNVGVALLAAMLLAMPVFSMTAEAQQTQLQQQRDARMRAERPSAYDPLSHYEQQRDARMRADRERRMQQQQQQQQRDAPMRAERDQAERGRLMREQWR